MADQAGEPHGRQGDAHGQKDKAQPDSCRQGKKPRHKQEMPACGRGCLFLVLFLKRNVFHGAQSFHGGIVTPQSLCGNTHVCCPYLAGERLGFQIVFPCFFRLLLQVAEVLQLQSGIVAAKVFQFLPRLRRTFFIGFQQFLLFFFLFTQSAQLFSLFPCIGEGGFQPCQLTLQGGDLTVAGSSLQLVLGLGQTIHGFLGA